MSRIEIRDRLGHVLFSRKCESVRECLEAAVASGTNMRGAILRREMLAGGRFPAALLTEADFSYSDLTNAQFSGALLSNARGVHVCAAGAEFRNADLTYGDWRNSDFSSARLTGAQCGFAHFTNSLFHGACMNGTFSGAHMYGAWLGQAMRPPGTFGEPHYTHYKDALYALCTRYPGLAMRMLRLLRDHPGHRAARLEPFHDILQTLGSPFSAAITEVPELWHRVGDWFAMFAANAVYGIVGRSQPIELRRSEYTRTENWLGDYVHATSGQYSPSGIAAPGASTASALRRLDLTRKEG